MGLFLGDSVPSKIFVGDTPISKVFLGDTQVRPSGGGGWQPGADTIAYFPFEDDQLDHSGNGLTIDNTMTKEIIGYSLTQATSNTSIPNNTFINFVGCWYNVNSISSTSLPLGILGITNLGYSIYYAGNATPSQRNKIVTYQGNNWGVVGNTEGMSYYNWHYLAYSLYNGVLYVCKDGVVSVQYNGTPYQYSDCNIVLMQKGSGISFKVTYSNLIAESEGWSAEDMSNYYNQTKANYGIS